MNDPETIKEKYAAMPNDQLLTFAGVESYQLTEEAIQLLKEEINRRGLLWPDRNEVINEEDTGKAYGISNDMIQFAIEEKIKGKSDESIKVALFEQGLSDEYAGLVIQQVPGQLDKLVSKSDIAILNGIIFLMAGISVTFLPLSSETHRALFILAWCSICFGAVKLLHSLLYKNNYRKALKNIHKDS